MTSNTPNQLTTAALPSNTSFGWFFSAVFTLIALYLFFRTPYVAIASVCLASAAALSAVTLTNADRLRPLNRLWSQFGRLIGRVISPLVLGALFFLVITPAAVISRALGRDELRMKPKDVETYWVKRNSNDISPESFKNQY